MTTTELAVVPTAGELPVLSRVKEGFDPLVEWAPPPVRSAAWALVVFLLLLALLSLLVRVALPYVGRALPGPAEAVINGLGMLLVLPEFIGTTALIRQRRQVPNLVFEYGEAVQGAVVSSQRAARSSLSALAQFRNVTKGWLVVALLVVFATWNGTYCGGRGPECRMPTTQWVDSIEAEANEAETKPDPAAVPPGS